MVDSGIGLLYWPDRLFIGWQAGPDNPMPESTLSPLSGTMNFAPVPFITEIIGAGSQGQGVTPEVVPLINVNICNHNYVIKIL